MVSLSQLIHSRDRSERDPDLFRFLIDHSLAAEAGSTRKDLGSSTGRLERGSGRRSGFDQSPSRAVAQIGLAVADALAAAHQRFPQS